MAAPHLYLTGYRGCGKSTVAQLLAIALNRPCVDLDDLIEASAGQTIQEIFAAETETGFRGRETAALNRLALHPPAVIALGGGAILASENRQQIGATGVCVWIDVPAPVLAERIAADRTSTTRRPSFTDQPLLKEVQTMLARREPLYRSAADHRIDAAGLTPQQLADAILTWWHAST